MLEVRDLRANIVATGSEVLKGVNFTIEEGQVAAMMGKNGCGKSTFSKVLVGHPDYEVTSGTVLYKGENLLDLEPEERARAGLFLSFQAPIEIPGVNNVDFLRMAANARRKAQGKDEFEPLDFYMHLQPKVPALPSADALYTRLNFWECSWSCIQELQSWPQGHVFRRSVHTDGPQRALCLNTCSNKYVCMQLESMNMDPSFLSRNVNEGFSGGEKKRNEILQLAVLEPEVAILDEIDSGLDVDALKDVSSAVNGLRCAAHTSHQCCSTVSNCPKVAVCTCA